MKSGVWQGGNSRPPAIDGRDVAAFVRQMQAMVPHYTPEWRFSPEDPDAGTALFYLAAEMLQENIKRLNRVPLANLISFLDMLQIRLRPARPSRTYAVFTLSEGASDPVYIPQGTRLTAAPVDGGDDIPFETETALLATPARLTDWLNAHPGHDRIVRVSENVERLADEAGPDGLPLFSAEGADIQEHALYIRHDDLFRMDRPAKITLTWSNAERRYAEPELAAALSRADWFEWSWRRGDEWVPFDRVENERQETTLWKTRPGVLEAQEVDGSEGRWIRCRVTRRSGDDAASEALTSLPAMDRIALRASHDAANDPDGIPPAALYHNDTELERENFYPFGEQILPYSAFHVACSEAFSKGGSRIRIHFRAQLAGNVVRNAPDPEIRWKMIMRTADFEPKPPERITIRRVQWEYWNGEGWARLPDSGIYERIFAELPEEEAVMRFVEFRCPEDWRTTYVNGNEDLWLRVRVLAMDPIASPVVEYLPPRFDHLSFTYDYASDARLKPSEVKTLNNAEWIDRTATARQGGETFKAFVPIDCPAPAVYWGFDRPPLKGPIRLHCTLGRRWPADEPPWIEWEAYVREPDGGWHWVPLRVQDETQGFTQSGAIQFVGPPGLETAAMFGRERAWLRAIIRDSGYANRQADFPAVTGLERNAVSAVQRMTIQDELPEAVKDGYQLSKAPVIAQEVWVDETGFLSEQALAEMDEERYEAIRDSEGRIGKLWVRWEETASFVGSLPQDRHYTIEPATGRIRFGDGMKGAALPSASSGKIRVTYQVTEGARGNIGSGGITGMTQSAAFIGGVTNKIAATGGGDAEWLEQAMRRGPQQLKHQGRAVSASDVEWLVREIDPSVSKVKCLPNRNARLERTTGSVAIVVLPSGGREGILHFPEMKRKIERELRERAPILVGQTGRLAIVPPALIEISVSAVVTVASAEDVVPAERECLAKLDAFLDTATGRQDGQGWDIGETVHASAFYGLFHAVRGVQSVEQIYLTVVRTDNGESKEIAPDDVRELLHGIVANGRHRVQVVQA